jgi:(E)-4-hydroxy-3-methylbut-2-enyl-diphosphate synthase
MVRVTVNLPDAAAAVRDRHARRRLHGAAHRRLSLQRSPAPDVRTRVRGCARQIPDQSATSDGQRRDEQFATSLPRGVDHAKPVRIGVNGGSLNQDLVVAKMQENTDRSRQG